MEVDYFVLSAALLLAVTALAVALTRQLRLGSVLGLLLAGIAVGPYSPGPHLTEEVATVRHFTELGVVLLLFLIGLEMRPRRLWELRYRVFGLGSAQILLTGLLLSAYFAIYQSDWMTALLIGLTLALSSTAFVLQLLQERGEIASPHGTTAFTVLLMQDLAIIPLLAAMPFLAGPGPADGGESLMVQFVTLLGMLGLLWVFGRYLIPLAIDRLMQQRNRDGAKLVILLAVLAPAAAMNLVGFSMALGAFATGLLLSTSRYHFQIQAQIEPYKGILMSLFFVAVGMSINLPELAAHAAILTQHIAVILAVKILVLVALAVAMGDAYRVAIRAAFYLAQGGEFGFVLFGAARGLQLIDDATFALMIGVISVTMLITPLLVRIGEWLAAHTGEPAPSPELAFSEQKAIDARVILGGYGRVGRVVATLLESTGISFIAFDTDSARVALGQEEKRPVYFGDISDPELIAAARPNQADLILITIGDSLAAQRAVSHLRNLSPDTAIIVRAPDIPDRERLEEAGATLVFPETLESSLRLGAESLEQLGVPEDRVETLLEGLRREEYALVRPAGEHPRSLTHGSE